MNSARLTIARMNLSDCLVAPQQADTYRECLTAFVQTDEAAGEKAQATTIATVEKAYGAEQTGERKPFIYNDGVAVIPVHGVLLNRFSGCWGFVTGYNFIRAQMNAADADPDVTLIVFDHNTPGGDAAGCFELTAEIRDLATPTLAVVDDMAASGGYATAAACNKVIATKSSSVGSIGVYRLHVSLAGANEQMGVRYTLVFAGEHKVDGNPFEDLPDSVREDMQASVDQRYDEFVADIVASRGLDEDVVRGTEARVYRANDALALGLIDSVDTPQNAVSAFVAELADDEPQEDEDDNMALPKTEAELASLIEAARTEGASSVKPVDADAVAKAAVTADRERRTAILALDEAKDKQGLAGKLADMDTTVETAKVILSAAATEKTEAPKDDKSALDRAMDKSGGGSKVKVDGEEPEGGDEDDKETVVVDGRTMSKASASLISHIPAGRRLTAVK